jgi:16S rRNA (cytidine1402-2'-O)-methyltransferase
MSTNPRNQATLWIVGMPLAEDENLSLPATAALKNASLIIAETRRTLIRYLRRAQLEDRPFHFLDNEKKTEQDDLRITLAQAFRDGAQVALVSDVGMPILFDPGQWVLDYCRTLGFTVRSVPGPTSWGTACALSGFDAPFHLLGFLPRERDARKQLLTQSAKLNSSCVFMETPYRFKLFIEQYKECFGPARPSFLAWDLGKATEFLIWGTVVEIEHECHKRGLEKGEFVWISKAPKKPKGNARYS